VLFTDAAKVRGPGPGPGLDDRDILDELIGSGGEAEVYRLKDSSLVGPDGGSLAVKVLKDPQKVTRVPAKQKPHLIQQGPPGLISCWPVSTLLAQLQRDQFP